MTPVWFVIWLIANNVGDHEALKVDPVNWWAGTLLLTLALDVSRAGGVPGRG
jgi:hypothetical protein